MEWIDTGARTGLLSRLRSLARRVRQRVRGVVGAPVIASSELTGDEQALIEAWSAAGSELRLCRGSASARVRGSTVIVGRERPEVRAAAGVVGGSDGWLYPIMLALAGVQIGAINIAYKNKWPFMLGVLVGGNK